MSEIADRVASRVIDAAAIMTIGEKTGRDAVTVWLQMFTRHERLDMSKIKSAMEMLDRKAGHLARTWKSSAIAQVEDAFDDDEPYLEAIGSRARFVKRITVLFEHPEERDFFIKEIEVR